MFKFKPRTESELNTLNLLTDGDYKLKIIKYEEKTSKSGNSMLSLTLRSIDNNVTVFDNLVDIDSFAYKIRHFADSCGIEHQYVKGGFEKLDCEGKVVMGRVRTQKGKDGYKDKNIIVDYLTETSFLKSPKLEISSQQETDFNDELPF